MAGMIESAKVRLDVVYLGPLGCSPVEKTGPCSDQLQNSPRVLGKGGQRPYGALYAGLLWVYTTVLAWYFTLQTGILDRSHTTDTSTHQTRH